MLIQKIHLFVESRQDKSDKNIQGRAGQLPAWLADNGYGKHMSKIMRQKNKKLPSFKFLGIYANSGIDFCKTNGIDLAKGCRKQPKKRSIGARGNGRRNDACMHNGIGSCAGNDAARGNHVKATAPGWHKFLPSIRKTIKPKSKSSRVGNDGNGNTASVVPDAYVTDYIDLPDSVTANATLTSKITAMRPKITFSEYLAKHEDTNWGIIFHFVDAKYLVIGSLIPAGTAYLKAKRMQTGDIIHGINGNRIVGMTLSEIKNIIDSLNIMTMHLTRYTGCDDGQLIVTAPRSIMRTNDMLTYDAPAPAPIPVTPTYIKCSYDTCATCSVALDEYCIRCNHWCCLLFEKKRLRRCSSCKRKQWEMNVQRYKIRTCNLDHVMPCIAATSPKPDWIGKKVIAPVGTRLGQGSSLCFLEEKVTGTIVNIDEDIDIGFLSGLECDIEIVTKQMYVDLGLDSWDERNTIIAKADDNLSVAFESEVPRSCIRTRTRVDDNDKGKEKEAGANDAPCSQLVLEMEVEVNFKNEGVWYPGKITRICDNGKCDITYDGALQFAPIRPYHEVVNNCLFNPKHPAGLGGILEKGNDSLAGPGTSSSEVQAADIERARRLTQKMQQSMDFVGHGGATKYVKPVGYDYSNKGARPAVTSATDLACDGCSGGYHCRIKWDTLGFSGTYCCYHVKQWTFIDVEAEEKEAKAKAAVVECDDHRKHPFIKILTDAAIKEFTLATMYESWKMHKEWPKPRPICSCVKSIFIQRNDLVFCIIKCFDQEFQRRQLSIQDQTYVKTYFVVLNSAQAVSILPPHAAMLESYDVVKFFDHLRHHDDASKTRNEDGTFADFGPPVLPTIPTNIFDFSIGKGAIHSNYFTTPATFHPSLGQKNRIMEYHSQWTIKHLHDAVSLFEIDEDKAKWLDAAVPIDRPTKDAEYAKKQESAKGRSRMARAGADRLNRMKMHFANIRDFHADKIEAKLKGALAAAECAYYAALAARHAQVYANAANILTKILAWQAAGYSAALVSQHAACAAYFCAMVAHKAVFPSLGLVPRIFSIIDKSVAFFVNNLTILGDWKASDRPAVQIRTWTKEPTAKLGKLRFGNAFTCNKRAYGFKAEFSIPHVKRLIEHAITNNLVAVGGLVYSMIRGIFQGGRWSSIFAKLFLCDFEDDYMSQFYLKILQNNKRIEKIRANLTDMKLCADARKFADMLKYAKGSTATKLPIQVEIVSYILPSNFDASLLERVSLLLKEIDECKANSKVTQALAEFYAHISRYADDISNTPLDKIHTLAKIIGSMYCGAVDVEDTAHCDARPHTLAKNGSAVYDGVRNLLYWISFLDARYDLDPDTNEIITGLYTKSDGGVLPFTPKGLEVPNSNTSQIMFALVFGGEMLRFYTLCSLYEHFIKFASRYLIQLLDKGYPAALLFTCMLKIFKGHSSGRYNNHPLDWMTDLREKLPDEYKKQHVRWHRSQIAKSRSTIVPKSSNPNNDKLATTRSTRRKIAFVSGGIIR